MSCTKRLNRSICRLGCGLQWTEGCTSSIVFARWRAPMCPHGRKHCRHLANTIEPSVYGGKAPYVKLIGPPCYLCTRPLIESRTDNRAIRAEYCIVCLPYMNTIQPSSYPVSLPNLVGVRRITTEIEEQVYAYIGWENTVFHYSRPRSR